MKRLLVALLILAVQGTSAQDIYNKARALLTARDTTGAVASFQEAAKAGQKLAETHYYLGAIAFARHRIDDAITSLQASLKADDEKIEAVKLLAMAFLEKKDNKNALTQLRFAAKIAPKDCEVSVLYGQALVAADSNDPAIVQLTKAQLCMPENPAIYLSLGDAYFKIGVKPLAISNYKKASELAPGNLDIQLKVARALSSNKQYNEAIDAYIVAEKIDSTFPDPYHEHGRILVLAKLFKPAVPPLARLVRLSPKNVEGSALYAKALFGSEYYADAAPAALASIQLDSSNADIWRIRAHSLVETKEFKSALEAFAALQRRNAIKPEDYVMMGRGYFGAAMDAEAMDSFLKALTIDSTNCEVFFPLGSLYMKKQDYKRASEMFEMKIACDPKSLSAYVNAALTYQQQNNLNLPRARELFLKVVELRPEYLNGRLYLARYYVQVDSFDVAEAQYLEVLRLIGDQVEKNKAVYGEAHKLLGSLYMIRKQYPRAIESFRKAQSVGADEKDGNMHLSWGQAILQTLDPKDPEEESRKKNDDALKHFRTCVQKDPNNVQGHFWLGECLIRSRVPGEDAKNKELKDEACAEWKKVLKLDPKNEDAKKGLERIGC